MEVLIDFFGLLEEVVPGYGGSALELEYWFRREIDFEEVLQNEGCPIVANNLQVLVLRNESGNDLRVLDLEAFAGEYLDAFSLLEGFILRTSRGVGFEAKFEIHRYNR